jgi:hypothetical protein
LFILHPTVFRFKKIKAKPHTYLLIS